MADQLNILKDIQKGISQSYLGGFNKIVNLDLDNVQGGATSSNRFLTVIPPTTTGVYDARTFTASADDTCTATTGSGITGYWEIGQSVTLTTTGTLPAGLATSTIYYAISLGAQTFKLADTLANAVAGTAVNITDTGTGTHTVTPISVGVNGWKNVLNYGNDYYALDSAGAIWLYNPVYLTAAVKIKGKTNAFNAIAIFKDYLLAFGATNGVEVFGSLDNTWSTGAWKTWDAGETPTLAHGGGAHPNVVMTNGILYIGDDNDIATLEETVGDTFDPTDKDSYVWTQSALDLPKGTYVSSLEQLGNYLMVGTFELKKQAAKIYPWDTFAMSFENPITCSGDAVYPMKTYNGALYFMTGDRTTGASNGKLYATNGSSVQQVAMLQNDGETQSYALPFTVYRNGVCIAKEKLYFGIGYAYRSGVYAYNPNTGSLHLEYTSPSYNEASAAPQCLCAYNNNIVLAGIDNSFTSSPHELRFAMLTTDYSTYRKATSAYFETGLMTVGSKYQPRTFRYFEIQLGKKLASGETITLSYRTNLTDSYTTIGTMSYTNEGAVASHIIENSVVTADQVQFKVAITVGSSATVAPEIKAIYLT